MCINLITPYFLCSDNCKSLTTFVNFVICALALHFRKHFLLKKNKKYCSNQLGRFKKAYPFQKILNHKRDRGGLMIPHFPAEPPFRTVVYYGTCE